MKADRYITILVIAILFVGIISSCRTHKDCRGRKKTVKTAMGGWL